MAAAILPHKKTIPTKDMMKKVVKPNMTLVEATKVCKEVYDSKLTKSVGCRVTGYVHFNYKNLDDEQEYLPITDVIEAGMIYFLKLSHNERIKFFAENSAQKVKVEDLKDTDIPFDEYLKNLLVKNRVPESIIEKLSIEDRIELAVSFLNTDNENR